MRQLARSAFATCTFVLFAAASAFPQARAAAVLPTLTAAHRAGPQPARFAASSFQQGAAPRDSLADGAWIGAIIGAVGTFGFGMYLCHAIREEGDPPCWKPALVLAGVGAGAGALAGAGVDALRLQAPLFGWSVRF